MLNIFSVEKSIEKSITRHKCIDIIISTVTTVNSVYHWWWQSE